jgi:hypothetical protein
MYLNNFLLRLRVICLLLIIDTTIHGAIAEVRFDSNDSTHICEGNTWGFYGHKRINRMAVFTLPPELFTFYKKHIEFITEHAVDPDKRRYAMKGEAERHYIDLDHYVHKGENPRDVMPKKWKDAVEKYSEDTLKAYGIVPWHLEVMLYRLTQAFKEQNLDRILNISADLGHYIGDAHVPLHTTKNYNGQLTNQKGIHGFWESRVPELYAQDYDYLVGQAMYISDPLETAWNVVLASHYAVDSVLSFEKQLTEEFASDKKFSFEQRGAVLMQVYSEEFSNAYQKRLNDMQQKRMRESIYITGCFWYTAWVNAGQPDLGSLGDKVSDDLRKEMEENDLHFKNGKIIGREHSNE